MQEKGTKKPQAGVDVPWAVVIAMPIFSSKGKKSQFWLRLHSAP